MIGLLERLRMDAGRRTLGELIQEREAAASEIERLSTELATLRGSRTRTVVSPISQEQESTSDLQGWRGRELLRLADVCRVLGLSRSTIYKRVNDKTFPRAIQVSERTVRWRSSDIAEWLRSIQAGKVK